MRTVLIITLSVYMSVCLNLRLLRIIDIINARKHWKAQRNHFTYWNTVRMKKLMGVPPNSKISQLPVKPISSLAQLVNLPVTFDARTKWSNCNTIGTIRNQGACGSCWAFSAAEAISDRICIATQGKQSLNISAQNILACCSTCGRGCDGGYPSEAWKYWIRNGVVSGGDYNSKQGCQPYTGDAYINGTTPTCMNQCQQGFTINYQDDLHNGSTVYSVPNSTMAIQTELFQNGSVQAVMKVYEDFMMYKKGIYRHITGALLGYHAVKILGWGTENNTSYWLIANSWSKNWGMNGFCKVIQGSKDINMEANVVAGNL